MRTQHIADQTLYLKFSDRKESDTRVFKKLQPIMFPSYSMTQVARAIRKF